MLVDMFGTANFYSFDQRAGQRHAQNAMPRAARAVDCMKAVNDRYRSTAARSGAFDVRTRSPPAHNGSAIDLRIA